jgi:hypothetical protein
MTASAPSWAWPLFPLIFGAPWIIAIAWYWRRRVRDGAIPPSMADYARERLSGRI